MAKTAYVDALRAVFLCSLLLFAIFMYQLIQPEQPEDSKQPKTQQPTGYATLQVTDTTPEGPVPFTIDGESVWDGQTVQTGLQTYNLTSGVEHELELPSPYTSPISDITYYFSYWQDDGSTDNPRTVTLEPDETVSLHGVYSTSSEPLPPPSPPQPDMTMPTNFLAYTGMEDGSVPPTYEEGWVGGFQVGAGGGDSYTNVVDKSWDVDVNGEPSGRSMRGVNPNPYDNYRLALTVARGSSGIWVNSETGEEGFYLSYWAYINEHYTGTYDQWFELREFDSASGKWGYPRGSIGLFLMGSGSNLYWYFLKGHTAENPAWCQSFGVYIYSNSWTWTKHPSDVNPDITQNDWIVNAHRVPWQTWFRFEIYVRRGSQQNGILTVWITDPTNPDPSKRDTRVLFHIENADTSDTAQYPSLQNWEPAFAKHYGMYLDIYYDEIYFYNYNIRGE